MHPVLKLWLRALPVYLRIHEIMKQEGVTRRRVAMESVSQDVSFVAGGRDWGAYSISHRRDYSIRISYGKSRLMEIKWGLESCRDDDRGEVRLTVFVEIRFNPDAFVEEAVKICFDARTGKWLKELALGVGTNKSAAPRLFRELNDASSSRSALSAIRKIAREYKKRRQQA
ncbi:MAG: hypothetical protein Q7N87_03920 [Candidatus Uhrbacteria bacterium]|nr:hypothetical protein [Candidatus Uhrbacteria bacterium]